MRIEVAMNGERAHTARAWMGSNAIHRLAPLLASVAAYEGRQVTIDGCHFREGLQVVRIGGGVASNVVPDRATVTLNHRFAPDRTPADAEAHVRSVVGEVDELEVTDMAVAAPPSLGHPLLQAVLAASGGVAYGKLGWTDVARFASRGVPATNFGPGDPSVAHSAGERVSRQDVETVYGVLRTVLEQG